MKSPPRLLLMSMPEERVSEALDATIDASGARMLLGPSPFSRSAWHQSLSDRHREDGSVPDLENRMRRAGARIHADAFDLTLTRITGKGGYCAFGAKGRPTAFDELLQSIRRALAAEGVKDEAGHSPHITLSYWGAAVTRSIPIKPVEWWIDHYDVLDRWELTPPPQLELFDSKA